MLGLLIAIIVFAVIFSVAFVPVAYQAIQAVLRKQRETEMAHEPEQQPPLRRVTDLRTGEVFWQQNWEFERLRAEVLYAPMNGTLRSWIKRQWLHLSWRWNREPWVRWAADRLARRPTSSGRNC